MRAALSLLAGLMIASFTFTSYAITINVYSPSEGVSGLGFYFNGKKYGGVGKSYSKTNMTPGTYIFGMRVNGIFGDDLGCYTQGKKTVSLTKDTNATLIYKNNACILQLR